MTLPSPAARRLATLVGLALGAVQLAACASGPAKAPPVAPAPPPPVAPAAPQIVTMAPIPNPEPAHERRAATRSHATTAAKHAKAPPPAQPGAPAAPASDPARAARLRAQGLEQLDRGAVARAVALLSEASRLDPSSTVIRHDLDRAQRIERAVHGTK